VASIFDLDRAKAQSLADAFAIGNVADSLEQAVQTAPEGAVFDVATPAAAHPSVIPQLPNGSGLLMQKPMGETLAQAREIRELCRGKNLTAAVNFQLRFAPAAHPTPDRQMAERGVASRQDALSRTQTSARKIHYYKCIGSDGWRKLGGPVCDNGRFVRQDLLDQIVWAEVARPTDTPVYASSDISRSRLQDSGPGWIRCFLSCRALSSPSRVEDWRPAP
jgi:Oxidoreductase family, NAD-binding Rossmann fold